MSKLILFNKPCGVLSQFSGEHSDRTLADYIDAPGYYPAGRLDKDSEGLLLLTDDGRLQQRIANPRYGKGKTYLAQVEGQATDEAVQRLRRGLKLKDGPTRSCEAELIADPGLWQRDPPIRFRKNVPTSWLRLTLTEGRNRQVRRMTAAVGFPTLRLVRIAVGQWQLDDLQPGQWLMQES